MGAVLACVSLAVFGSAAPASAAPGPATAPEWWFDTWNVPALWAAGANGNGITIAEIDTGVNGAIPAIAGNLVQGFDFGPGGGNGWVDHETALFGHGTAMASLIVATKGAQGVTGLAPNASLMPIALPINGTDDAAAAGADHLAEAIRWAVDHGAKIVNLSLGGMRYPNEDPSPCPDDEQGAITYAISKGAIVVAAAGNGGQTGSPVEDPAVCLGVVSVGAVDRSNNVADFSSRHPNLTLTAPGVNIASLSRTPGSVYNGQGTSQATAITSAALALIWSKFPNLSAREVVSKALSSLDHASATRDPGYGFGIINPDRAIASGNPQAANVVYDSIAPFVQQLTAADSVAQTKVPAATFQKSVPGVFSVGGTPSAVTASVVHSVIVALGGLLALVVLLVVGVRSHRRRLAFGQTTTAALAFAGSSAPGSTPAPPVGQPVTPPNPGRPAVAASDSGAPVLRRAELNAAEPNDAGPEAAGPESAGPESAEPESVEPESVGPDSAAPDSAELDSAAPDSAPANNPKPVSPIGPDPTLMRSTDWSEITPSASLE